MATVEYASTWPTAITSTGMAFILTVPTTTGIGGRGCGAACCLAQPDSAAKTANAAGASARGMLLRHTFTCVKDLVIILEITYPGSANVFLDLHSAGQLLDGPGRKQVTTKRRRTVTASGGCRAYFMQQANTVFHLKYAVIYLYAPSALDLMPSRADWNVCQS